MQSVVVNFARIKKNGKITERIKIRLKISGKNNTFAVLRVKCRFYVKQKKKGAIDERVKKKKKKWRQLKEPRSLESSRQTPTNSTKVTFK